MFWKNKLEEFLNEEFARYELSGDKKEFIDSVVSEVVDNIAKKFCQLGFVRGYKSMLGLYEELVTIKVTSIEDLCKIAEAEGEKAFMQLKKAV